MSTAPFTPRENSRQTAIQYYKNGHHLAFVDDCGFTHLPEFHDCEVTRGRQPGSRHQNNHGGASLLSNPEGFRIPNAGLEGLVHFNGQSLPLHVTGTRTSPPIKQLPPAQFREHLQHPSLAQFALERERGQIHISRGMDPVIILTQLALAFNTCTITVLGAKVNKLQSARHKFLESMPAHLFNAGQVQLIHDRQPFAAEIESAGPQILFSTFSAVAESDFATTDIVVFLDGYECQSKKALEALEQTDAQFRLYCILKDRPVAPSEYKRICSIFGFQLIDLKSHARVRRETGIAWVPVRPPRNRSATMMRAIEYPRCYLDCGYRNDRITRLCKALAKGNPYLRKNHQAVAEFLGRLPRVAPSITLLVNHIEHAVKLARNLPDWPVFIGDRSYNLRGLPGSLRRRFQCQLEPGYLKQQIVLTDATDQFPGYSSDVIIWAGGGSQVKMIPHSWFYHRETEGPSPLLIFDFEDQFNPETRCWAQSRKQQYADREIYEFNTNPEKQRMLKFLSMRGRTPHAS